MSDNLSLTWNLNDEVLCDKNEVSRMITEYNQEKSKVKLKQEKLRKGKAKQEDEEKED